MMSGKKLDIKLDHIVCTYSIKLGSPATLTIADVAGLFFFDFPGFILNDDPTFNIYIYPGAISNYFIVGFIYLI